MGEWDHRSSTVRVRLITVSDRKGEVKIGDFGLASMKGLIADPNDMSDDAVSVSSKGTITDGE